MKILVISDSCTSWSKQFIENTLLKMDGYTVGFLCLTRVPEEWMEYYRQLNVHIMELPAEVCRDWMTAGKRIDKKISAFLKGMRFFSMLNEYDILNYQFVSARLLPFFLSVRETEKKLVLSYWGSDLLRQGQKAERIEGLFLKYKGIAFATFDNLDLKDVFFAKYRFRRSRAATAYFADPVLDAMRCIAGQKADIYAVDGKQLPADMVITAVGYNGKKEQQHLKVIEQLSKLDDAYKNRMLVLLQMTYGAEGEYKNLCLRKCGQNGIHAVLFDQYLSNLDVARIRMAADIFINSQTTDAFAGSFCEYLYTGTCVLNAAWLHYKEIDRYQLDCEEYRSFDEIPALMEKAMDSRGKEKRNREGRNREAIWKLRSAKACMKRWEKVFSAVAENAAV